MKNLIAIICLLFVTSNVFGQKVASVEVKINASKEEVLKQCKESGKKSNWGNRDYNLEAGTLTLWQEFFRFASDDNEFYAYISVIEENGISTLNIKVPHNSAVIMNEKKQVKKLVKGLKFDDMEIGKYFYGIK